MNLKKLLSGLIVLGVVLSSSAHTVAALEFEGEFEGDPIGVSKIEAVVYVNPVPVHQDIDIGLRTKADGAELAESLDLLLNDKPLAMQITTAAGANILKVAPLNVNVDSPWYSAAMSNDSTLRVTINVDDDNQMDVNSVAMPPGDYKVIFGAYNNANNSISKIADTTFTIKANGVVNFVPSGLDFGGVDFGDLVIGDLNDLDFGDLFDENDRDDGQFVINPDKIVALPNPVKPDSQVRVSLYKDLIDADDIQLSLPVDWDLQLWTVAGIAGPEVMSLSLQDGDFAISDLANSDADAYDFYSPIQPMNYSVKLVDAEGNLVAKNTITVKADAQNPWDVFVLPGLEDGLINLPDILDGLVADDGADAGDDDEGDMAEVEIRCGDLGEDDWEYEMVNTLLDMDLFPVEITPVSLECRTNEAVTRKEFTAWLLRTYHPGEVANMDPADLAEMPFSDVDLDDPYALYILKAHELGIINGHPDGTFKPNVGINRAEVLKILLISSGVFENSGDDVENLMQNHEDKDPSQKFKDVKDGDVWFYDYLWFAISRGIIQGYPDGTAKMERTVLYGEAAKILYLSLQLEGRIN